MCRKYLLIIFVLLIVFEFTACTFEVEHTGKKLDPTESCKDKSIELYADQEFENVDLYPVFVNGKWGYIDKEGNMIIEPKFDGGFEFSDGLAEFISQDGKYGYINKKGEVVIEPTFYYGGGFEDGIAPVFLELNEFRDKPYSYIDKTGQVVVNTNYLYVTSFREDLMRVSTNGEKYGFCD